MASSVKSFAALNGPLEEGDPRKIALERVLRSAAFQRSPRCTGLLSYLCNRTFSEACDSISEQQIAVDVFGRKPGYSSSDDTIARVQVSQLRKKLHYYFIEEGRTDPTIIEIPPGSYVPVFQAREPEPVPRPEPLPVEAEPKSRPSKHTLLLICLALSLGTCIWLFYDNRVLQSHARSAGLQSLPAPSSPTPSLDRLWQGVFHRDRPLQVVLSDSSLMELSDLIGRRITLREYRDPYFPRKFLEEQVSDPRTLLWADKLSGHVYTTTQDVDAVWQISRLTMRYGISANVISARDFRMTTQGDADLILLGHSKSNPWMELFEDRMNFHYFLPTNGYARLINSRPLRGELPQYVLDQPRTGYCVLAYQPKPIGNGNALLILGSDMSSLEAGLRIISENLQASELLHRIRASASGPLPYFEMLVKVKLLGNVSPGYEFLAQRVLPN